MILSCNNSTNEIRIITPAENPIIKEINRGLGFLIKNAIKLPIVVANPAKKLKSKAKRKSSIQLSPKEIQKLMLSIFLGTLL